jgi:hypothetical protein
MLLGVYPQQHACKHSHVLLVVSTTLSKEGRHAAWVFGTMWHRGGSLHMPPSLLLRMTVPPLRSCTSPHPQLATQRVDEAVLHVPARPGSAEQAPVKDLLATVLNSNAPNKANAKEATGHDSTGVSSNVARTALFGYAKATCSGLYPSMWHKQTEQLVTEAQQLVTDSSR